MRDTKQEILHFWFEELEPQQWFEADPALDSEIKERFGLIYDMAGDGLYDDWSADPNGCLALVILLDQFPRNIYRGKPQSFFTDITALSIAEETVRRGLDKALEPLARAFLYMPFMHAEDLAEQEMALKLFEEISESYPEGKEFARRHYEAIKRFGRFPHRNKILGRQSTPEEEQFLKEHDGFL